MDTDSDLVARAQNGDSAAFDQLAQRARPWLYGLCFRLARDCETAQDLVQETLIAAFRSIAQLRDPAHFNGWIARIAVNTCRMHLRRVARLPETSSAQLPQPETAGTTAPPLSVGDALANIDARDRHILLLYYDEGLSHAELAELLALSAAAVKSRLHRARERLRKEMIGTMTDHDKTRLGVDEAPWALRRILLVEPDPAVREPVRAALAAAGYEVIVLPTGEAALEAASQRRGDMLILDKHCGEPHWLEVLLSVQLDAWARENLPVGVFVDPDSKRDVFLAWQAGAFLCLTRPPDPEELVRFVQRIGRVWPDRPYTLIKRHYAP